MRRMFICIGFLICLTALFAQQGVDRMDIRDLLITRQDDRANISFLGKVSRKAVQNNHALIYAPLITNGRYAHSLPEMIIYGTGAKASFERHEWAMNADVSNEQRLVLQNEEIFKYEASVPFQRWMEDSQLILESILLGCCEVEAIKREVLAENIFPTTTYELIEEPGGESVSIGDTLSLAFSFVLPESEWNENEPVYDEDRENALIVYFRRGFSSIEPDIYENGRTLSNLIAAVNIINNSADSEVKHIVVAGFASPEGSFEINDRLAWERAVSVKEHIMRSTGMPGNLIKLYNGSEDWRGLRAMIAASNLSDKHTLLSIIDNVPIGDKKKIRLDEIKKLNGGRTYDYLYENFFPKLRNGAFIRVYYKNK